MAGILRWRGALRQDGACRQRTRQYHLTRLPENILHSTHLPLARLYTQSHCKRIATLKGVRCSVSGEGFLRPYNRATNIHLTGCFGPGLTFSSLPGVVR